MVKPFDSPSLTDGTGSKALKILLIVFPYTTYVKWEEETHLRWVQSVCLKVSESEFQEEYCRWPVYLVADYRRRGFQVWFLTFSRRNDLLKPSLRVISRNWGYQRDDVVIPAGVTYKQLCKWEYPKFGRLVRRLPAEVEEIVVGGFHYSDCVKKAAQAAKRRFGWEKVKVDPQLTNLLYYDLAIELSKAPSYRPDED